MHFSSPKSNREHTRWQALVFRAKATGLQGWRMWQDARGGDVPGFQPGDAGEEVTVCAESRSLLWTPGNAAERRLQEGKVENLRLAARRMHGVTVTRGAVFSFWKQVGRPVARRGFVPGRELREGCIIPSVGGGLCQLSNALYDCALQAGLEVVERHAHSQVIPGSLAEQGRDATVFWNYVDLRFRAAEDLRIEVELDAEWLTVRFFARLKRQISHGDTEQHGGVKKGVLPASCASCGMVSCFRNIESEPVASELTAVLVDECWPEFDGWLQGLTTGRRVLRVPWLAVQRYGWTRTGFERVRQFPGFVLGRSLESRRLAAQGAARQRALLAQDERLARLYARSLTFEMTHLIVTQSLLPWLWRDGVLGGRTFEVLLTRWPLWSLQEKLDAAARLHPESATLADFRAEPWRVQAERMALQHAQRVITPHPGLAGLFCEKALRLDWVMPQTSKTPAARGKRVVFPASTLGRKGAYEMRDALRSGAVERLTLAGPVLETPDFWAGLPVDFAGEDWLVDAGLVVLPSWVENRPRRLLQAIARGIPVIATAECGVEGLPGVTIIPAGDATALRVALATLR